MLEFQKISLGNIGGNEKVKEVIFLLFMMLTLKIILMICISLKFEGRRNNDKEKNYCEVGDQFQEQRRT